MILGFLLSLYKMQICIIRMIHAACFGAEVQDPLSALIGRECVYLIENSGAFVPVPPYDSNLAVRIRLLP